jgi:hypothetical protein
LLDIVSEIKLCHLYVTIKRIWADPSDTRTKSGQHERGAIVEGIENDFSDIIVDYKLHAEDTKV